MTEKRYIAEWYEGNAFDAEGFQSDILHTSTHTTLAAAKRKSMQKSIEHGTMVFGSVIEQERNHFYGWESTATYVNEHFDDEWQGWEKQFR